MRLRIKIAVARIKYLMNKVHEEAKKIALAVVILEFILVLGYAYTKNKGYLEFLEPKTVYIEPAHAEESPEVKPEASKLPVEEISDVERIADTIYTLESTQGKNNYSKCEAVGKVNGIGYGIDGSGKYQCFENHAEEMKTLKAWISKHFAEGMNEKELKCHYSGSNYKECKN